MPVTQRALLQRINRALQKKGESLKKGRVENTELGDFYSIDLERSEVRQAHVNLEALGRELGVLQLWEALAT